jgi:replication-associated recombination protein RarA
VHPGGDEVNGSFEFPQPLSEKYRPKTIDGFIGLDKPKIVLQAFAARPFPSAWLFLGYSGIGKTTMAMALAEEIGAEFQHIPSRNCDEDTIESVCRRCHYVPLNGGMHLVLVDEADLMANAAQNLFLSKLDSTEFPPATIFIFTANGASNFHERFISRCRVLLFEQDQLAKELPAFLRKVFKRECGKALDNSKQLAAQSGFNVRDALSNLEIELLTKGRRR